MTTVRRGFTLDTERDAELLERLDGEKNVSAVVRQALREHYGLEVSLGDVYRLLQEVAAGRPVADTPRREEDPDLAAALDGLGL
ncbi:MAG: hypothetical protein ACLFU8_13125 [Anaerolineales bacterium]